MLSEIPVKLEKVGEESINREIMRVATIAKLDAINLYEQLAAMTDDVNLKKLLLDVAKKEKTHLRVSNVIFET